MLMWVLGGSYCVSRWSLWIFWGGCWSVAMEFLGVSVLARVLLCIDWGFGWLLGIMGVVRVLLGGCQGFWGLPECSMWFLGVLY